MNNLEYEQPYFYIAIPYFKEVPYIFYPSNDAITTLTIFEDCALTFRCISDALKWYEKNFNRLKHEVEEKSPECFDWDKVVIIKKEYTIIPL